jgi:hypothetical protein
MREFRKAVSGEYEKEEKKEEPRTQAKS